MEHAPPPFFRRGPPPLVRLLVCALLALALLIFDAHYSYLNSIRSAVSVMTYPLQRLPTAVSGMFGRIGEFFVTQSSLRNENAQLAAQDLNDAAALQKYKALEAENEHLRSLLEMHQRSPQTMQAADILYDGRDPFSHRIVINKGSQNGIAAGQPVIDHIGVIGQVTRVYPWLSEVTLITDDGQLIPVQNLRNGLRAVLGGSGNDGRLELKFIPLNADFQNGDQLVTSGIDGVYPSGLPVAVVSNVERDAAYLFARITCKPLAGVASHDQVLVVTTANTTPPRPVPEVKKPATSKRRQN